MTGPGMLIDEAVMTDSVADVAPLEVAVGSGGAKGEEKGGGGGRVAVG